jgi:hypothetical protein
MNGYGVRRQAKRDAALHNFVSGVQLDYQGPPWISGSPTKVCSPDFHAIASETPHPEHSLGA